MKNYVVYRIKKCLPMLAVMCVAAVAFYVLPLLGENYDYWNGIVLGTIEPPEYYYAVQTYTLNILVLLTLFCLAVPFYMFSYRMSRRSADMYYSLPITRTRLFCVQFWVGFGAIIAAYSAGYLLGFIVAVAKIRGLNYIWYLWGYLASIVPAYCVYALTVFMVTRANTMADAAILVFFSHFALMVVAAFVSNLADGFVPEGNFILSAPLLLTLDSRLFRNLWTTSGWYFGAGFNWAACELTAGIIITLLAAAATAWAFLNEKNVPAEDCGQITESIFGYKMLIPIYYVLGSVTLCSRTDFMWSLPLLALCAYAGMAVWRRSIKLGSAYVLFATCTAAAVTLFVLIKF